MKFLFDLGGVFFDWDPNHFYKDIFSNPHEREDFLKTVCNDEWNIKQDKGRLIKEAEIELILKYPNYENEIKMYYKNHRKMFRKLFNKSIEALIFLKEKKYECYVLSNWSWETFVNLENEYPFLKMFDDLLISGKEKMIKPDAEIYLLAIERFNLLPNHTVFIDDKIENINAAKNLSFKTIHLDNPELIIDKIKQFL
tara:strand:- start:263 stop:853 length:591 start_codon:yes stop_codon:yes gene_type:complete